MNDVRWPSGHLDGDWLDGDSPRDGLTGLSGLDGLRARLRQWGLGMAHPVESAPIIHGLLLGIRRFGAVNLAFGIAAGDRALIVVAERLTRFAGCELGGESLAARGGDDHFLIVANEACSRERWHMFAEHLADLVAEPIGYLGETLRLSPCVALSRALPQDDANQLLGRLGQSLDAAKRNMGRRVVWADDERAAMGRSGAQLESDLLKAIDHDEIEVVFQPQFALAKAGKAGDFLSGAEALARWNHPALGRIGAAELFTIAERSDHIVPLTRHIATIALAHAARWPADLRLSLNITPADLARWSFTADMCAALHRSGFSPHLLTLEVTEQTLLSDIELAARSLTDIVAQGVRIALDDFGAGFCNFRYLKMLPLHYLKLDRSMIDNIVEDPRDLAVLRAIVVMADALDLKVIAEGVETEAQAAMVAREGCAYLQGFLRAQPLSAVDFLKLANEILAPGTPS